MWLRSGSLTLHGLLLAWLLHEPAPARLTANSVALGQNGNSVARLFWSSRLPTTAFTVHPTGPLSATVTSALAKG